MTERCECEGCHSGRPGNWWYPGMPICWVCRWVRWPLIHLNAPDWMLWIVDHVLDRKGGVEK